MLRSHIFITFLWECNHIHIHILGHLTSRPIWIPLLQIDYSELPPGSLLIIHRCVCLKRNTHSFILHTVTDLLNHMSALADTSQCLLTKNMPITSAETNACGYFRVSPQNESLEFSFSFAPKLTLGLNHSTSECVHCKEKKEKDNRHRLKRPRLSPLGLNP